MAENITQYKAGKTLVALLQQHGLKDNAIQQITGAVADLLEEAGRSGAAQEPGKRCAEAPGKVQQAQQQQQQQPANVRDLATADAVLQGVSLVIPRGKFECGFYSDCMQVTNKQTSAEIPYSSIQHVLIIDAVPKQPNTTFLVLVMKRGQPVRQGKNALDLVVMQTKDQPELSIPSPEVCQHLGPQLVGAAAVVLSQLLASYIEGISEDTFLTADASVFSSSAGDLMVAANKGAQPGWLVPLSAGLCYLGKQGSFMPRDSISRLVFHRTGGTSATFDVTIELAAAAGSGGSGSSSRPLELGQIDAAELPKLQAYCMNQRLRMGGDDDNSDDEEGAAAAAGGAAGAAVAAAATAATAAGGGGESDDDEEDEDFDPEASGRQQKRRRLDGGGAAAAAAAGGEGADSGDDEEEEEEYAGSDDDDGSSDPELVATDDLSDMQEEDGDEGLGDYE